MDEPRSVWRLGAELGEGPAWDARDAALWFVDIKAPAIHRFDPASGERRTWPAPEYVGFVLPARGGGFVAGLKSGLHRFDPGDGSFALLAAVEPELADNRLNDGAVDSAGRVWFGTMDNREAAPSGRFYRYAGGALAEAGLPAACITNGPAISPDGRLLYHVDTLAREIRVSEIADDLSLRATRTLVRIDHGYPDGPTVDAEGCVWIGLYAGWSARRYAPTGELLASVRFPTANVTKLAFGGDDLRTVYATTARQGLTPEQLAEQPEAGSLFAFRADVRGLATPLAAI